MSVSSRIFNKFLSFFNVKLTRIPFAKQTDFSAVYDMNEPENKIIDINRLAALSENIEGMLSSRAGQELFSIAYMQSLKGNVLEIGSFQGKSTFFLGQAVAASRNGRMYAVDHFKGNVNYESRYVVNNDDLSDLETGFQKNMEKAGLTKVVKLINKPSYQAVNEIEDDSLRLLFIDGDHSEEGVRRDLDNFKPKLKSGAIIIFDDYNPSCPGVVSVVTEFISESNLKRKYLLNRTLVVQLN